MKKHELIKAAYDNFPKGTKFTWGGDDIISTGKFHFNDDTIVVSDDEIEYIVFDGKNWATIIPDSILSGKCAIQVNNEREFKLLMEHYEGRGWISIGGDIPCKVQYCSDQPYFRYENNFGYSMKYAKDAGYKIIPFQDFAAEIGVEVPVFVMTSEDGVDLYEQDFYYTAIYRDEWHLDSHACSHKTGGDRNKFVMDKGRKFNNNLKAFSTKEAAEAWIKEQNKPKEIIVSKNSSFPVKVTNNEIKILCGDTENHKYNIIISPIELEEMYTAYKSLQS